MPTVPHSANWHYRAAERLLDAAESSVSADTQTTAALTGIGHALLTLSPRRARRPEPPRRHVSGDLTPQQKWVFGKDSEQ
jgi:hypothetical protein